MTKNSFTAKLAAVKSLSGLSVITLTAQTPKTLRRQKKALAAKRLALSKPKAKRLPKKTILASI